MFYFVLEHFVHQYFLIILTLLYLTFYQVRVLLTLRLTGSDAVSPACVAEYGPGADVVREQGDEGAGQEEDAGHLPHGHLPHHLLAEAG